MGIFDFFKTKEKVPFQKIYKELDIFTATSLAMPKMNNPFLLDNKNKHPMIFGYFMGAIDYMQQAYELSEKDKGIVYAHYLLNNFTNNDEEYAKELLTYSEAIREEEDVNSYMLRGKLAMKKMESRRSYGGLCSYGTHKNFKRLNIFEENISPFEAIHYAH